MRADRWPIIKEVLTEALERAPLERDSWVVSRCAGDPQLLEEVRSLLRQQDMQPLMALPDPLSVAHFLREHRAGLAVGRHIDKFEVIDVLGYGGMGVVYRARQDNPNREVALKIIPAALHASPYQIKLFQREVQSLARMQHPGIATLYETGATDDGHHYFSMELVHGSPLMDYAEKHQLSVHQRLKLFTKVCDSVHYAHQKGVIHRDIKPGNILVTQDGMPKLLDFGLARLMEQDSATLSTVLGKVHGTLSYMSPEQARGSSELDVRSDVYSLGVVLYELLTHRLPLDLAQRSIPQALDAICNQLPPRAGTLSAALRGDMETIMTKALAKEPERRYQSAHALAEDIERFQSKQPISARPPSAGYQFSKFASRHRSLVASLLLALVFVCAFGVWMSILYARSEAHLARAQTAESQAAAQAARAQQALHFLTDVFKVSDPSISHGKAVTAQEILDRGADRLAAEFSGDAATRAELLEIVGTIYQNLGLDSSALRAYESALDSLAPLKQHLSSRTRLRLLVAESLENLGERLQAEMNARALLRDMSDGLSPRQSEVARVHALLGRTVCTQGKFSEAEEHFRTAREFAVLAADKGLEGSICSDLGGCLKNQGKFSEAVDAHQEAVDLSGKHYIQMSNLAEALQQLGRFNEAGELYRQATEQRINDLGPDHPAVARAMANYSIFLVESRGDFDEATRLQSQALEIRRRHLGAEHPDVAHSLKSLAFLSYQKAERVPGDKMYAEALAIEKKAFGPRSPEVAHTLLRWGGDMSTVDCEQARPLLEEALQLHLAIHGDLHAQTVDAMNFLARCVEPRKASELQKTAFEAGVKLSANNPGKLAYLLRTRGWSLLDEDIVQSQSLLEEALRLQREHNGDHVTVASTLTMLAAIHLKQDEPEKAEPLLREALSIRIPRLPADHHLTANTRCVLGECLYRLERFEEAEQLLIEGHSTLLAKLNKNHQLVIEATQRLVRLYEQWGRADEASKWKETLVRN